MSKVTDSHRQRKAFVYVRQSSATQVLEHKESARRQYQLKVRAIQLGWEPKSVEVIDDDQGKSGASATGRTGFARLVHAVAHGEAGAIFATEVSRLARSSEDWQRLLNLCGVAKVLVLDEQTVYDPSCADDKLLLDLKGTMSEAELHWLRLRMVGARRSKARRGKLRMHLPTGYVWTEAGIQKDPNQAIRDAISAIFERYLVEPSVWALVRWARQRKLKLPTRLPSDEVLWKPVSISRVYDMLHNPVFAGTYSYGRRPMETKLIDGQIRKVRRNDPSPRKWAVCLTDAHPGYISWEQFLDNQNKLSQNTTMMNRSASGAPKEGAARLSGLLICGRCGRNMHVSYTGRGYYTYTCVGARSHGQKVCWTVPGHAIDMAIEERFFKAFVPEELDLTLAVDQEVRKQAEKLNQTWRSRIEQAEYEARQAERRYKAVDPDNRVVARTLEAQWEEKLIALREAHEELARAKEEHRTQLTAEDRMLIRQLSRDLPKVWHAKSTSTADRKAMLRMAIEAITITPYEAPNRVTRTQVQWKSGHIETFEIPRPHRKQKSRTPEASTQKIRELAKQGFRDDEIARQLNQEGYLTGQKRYWTIHAVKWARRKAHIVLTAPDRTRRHPLPLRHPEDGRYSIKGASLHFGVSQTVIRNWIRKEWLPADKEPFGQYRNILWIPIDQSLRDRIAQKYTNLPARNPC